LEVNILVVEDNNESAKKLDQILKPLDYKYWIIEPQDLEKMLKTIQFSVVLTELRMPYINGEQVTKNVLQSSSTTNVVIMTGYSFINSAVKIMEAGAYNYVTKPFNPLEIRLILKRAVERHFMLLKEGTKNYYMDLSVKDGLTGLYNRRFLDAQLSKKVADFKKIRYKNFSVVMIDVDNFKQYNDRYGHVSGDKLLRDLAALFQDTLRMREMDSVFRYGGEEFCIILNDADKKEAVMVSERIRILVTLYLTETISLGVATFPIDGDNPKDLIGKADQALYIAKREGKNRVVSTLGSVNE